VDLSLYTELFPSLPSKSKNNRTKKKQLQKAVTNNSNSSGSGSGSSGSSEQLIGFLGAGKQQNLIDKQLSQAKKRSSKRNGELQGQKNGSRPGNNSFAGAVTNQNLSNGMSEALRLRMAETLEKKSSSSNGGSRAASWAAKASK
jgi:hypothetical protein